MGPNDLRKVLRTRRPISSAIETWTFFAPVLKIALTDDDNIRLEGEAEALASIQSEFVVKLLDKHEMKNELKQLVIIDHLLLGLRVQQHRD